ncbi:MAG: hypothetical protein JXR96_22860 [Deltaproteobacteria bacterium]|nr:hypothetical protein [Deltaproteobacteria bacterium]
MSENTNGSGRLRKVLIGIAIAIGVLAFLVLFTPLGGPIMAAVDSVFGGEVKSRQQYRGAIIETKGSERLDVGERCEVEVRCEDRLFGDMVKVVLRCGGRALYGQEDAAGWIMESTMRDGEVVRALDQWDDEGDPGIEFDKDRGMVRYWDKTGLQLKIALEGLGSGELPAEHDPAGVPAEKPAPTGVEADAAMTKPEPQVSETCAPGVVCWGKRMDVDL